MALHPEKPHQMKKFVAAALVGLFAAQVTLADMADISTITCADLAEMPTGSVAMPLTWIDGDMGGQASDTGFDVGRLQTKIDGAAALCAENPDPP